MSKQQMKVALNEVKRNNSGHVFTLRFAVLSTTYSF